MGGDLFRRAHPHVVDAALGALIATGLLLDIAFLSTPVTAPRPLDHALVVVGGAAAAYRRRPVAALAVSTACMLAFALRTEPGPVAAFPVLIAVNTAAREGRKGPVALAAVAFLGGYLTTDPDGLTSSSAQSTLLLLGWFTAAIAMAGVDRHRRAYLRQVEERAAEAERTREETALRRAGEERLRIARELHDSLTHSISVIKLQAGVAVHLARKRGEEVPETLLAIQEASGDAMRELRATLEVLRSPEDGAPAGAPPNGLGRIGELADRSRAAGLPVTVTVSGRWAVLPEAVGEAAYRIVQEALTNAARHAGPAASASVSIAHAEGRLVVQVDDDGTADPSASPEPGVGLTGMRERVHALGGRLSAAPRARGGFSVRAELPLRPAVSMAEER